MDQLRAELANSRVEFAKKAAGALDKQLQAVAAFHHGGCPSCRDAEARAFLAKFQRIAEGVVGVPPPSEQGTSPWRPRREVGPGFPGYLGSTWASAAMPGPRPCAAGGATRRSQAGTPLRGQGGRRARQRPRAFPPRRRRLASRLSTPAPEALWSRGGVQGEANGLEVQASAREPRAQVSGRLGALLVGAAGDRMEQELPGIPTHEDRVSLDRDFLARSSERSSQTPRSEALVSGGCRRARTRPRRSTESVEAV